jgi:hypothetical protein
LTMGDPNVMPSSNRQRAAVLRIADRQFAA